MTIMVGHGRL